MFGPFGARLQSHQSYSYAREWWCCKEMHGGAKGQGSTEVRYTMVGEEAQRKKLEKKKNPRRETPQQQQQTSQQETQQTTNHNDCSTPAVADPTRTKTRLRGQRLQAPMIGQGDNDVAPNLAEACSTQSRGWCSNLPT